MKRNRIVDGITKTMDQMGEPVPGETLTELYGGRRVLIEHHKGITEYRSDRIQVRTRRGCLCVTGCGLEIQKMSGDVLVITGRIDGISVFHGG